MNERWILDDLSAALARLGDALVENPSSDLGKAGCIQYFEFSFELSWKAIKIFASQLGLDDCLSPKSCLKLAFGQTWIEEESVWLEMLEARNRLAHTYDAKNALVIYARLPEFHGAMRALLNVLLEQAG
jgi:nucleotidyltransferase substrate binding protein (TIGR01987 family)